MNTCHEIEIKYQSKNLIKNKKNKQNEYRKHSQRKKCKDY